MNQRLPLTLLLCIYLVLETSCHKPIPNPSYEMIGNSGHFPYIEAQNELVSIINDFIITSPEEVQINASTDIQKIDIFPFQSQHVHGSTLVELSDGSLLAAWFQGSGERQADDVAIYGARYQLGADQWSEAFLMADVPGFPDTNPVLFVDPQERLWLMWYTVLANQWESSLLKYRISEDYLSAGSPKWAWQEVIHVKAGGSTEQGIQADDRFVLAVKNKFAEYYDYLETSGMFEQLPTKVEQDSLRNLFHARVSALVALAGGSDMMARGTTTDQAGNRIGQQMGYPRFRRLGWQTRNRPLSLPSGRMIVPLYSDGFDFSLMAITDDGGQHWLFSEPLVSIGGVQPALLLRKDGTIFSLMRDNGPPPQRLLMSQSNDQGMSWSPVVDSDIPNSGAAAEMLALSDGRWLLVHNGTEEGRYALEVSLSEDEGVSWKTALQIEYDRTKVARAHYPSVVQDQTGKIHLLYSYHTRSAEAQAAKTIRHASFWLEDFVKK